MKNRTFSAIRTRRPRRRRGRARLFVLGAAFLATTATAASADAGPVTATEQAVGSSGGQKTGSPGDPRRDRADSAAPDVPGVAIRFDIPPAPLDVVLAQYEQATGIRPVLAEPGLGVIPSPGVAGTFTAAQAMERLLMGTSTSGVFASDHTVTVGLARLAEFVEVSGDAPGVASPKYTVPLRDIPQTINVIPQALIQEQGATTLRDVLRNVVGITFQAGEGGVPAGDQLTIRGFSARTDMFIDGVRDFGGYSRDSFNLEQVEVSKGPSSAIAGRGSTGGAINQVSKAPHAARSYDVSVGGGNGDYKRTSADVNQPLGGGAALRVNAMWNDTGVPGRDVVESERWGVAPSLVFGVISPSRLTISHLHLQQHNIPEYGLPWVPANTNPELAAYANGQPPVDSSNFYGLVTRDYEDTVTDVTSAQLDHRASDVLSLRNLARYGRSDRDSVITTPRFANVNTGTAINRQLQSRDMVDTIVANQTSAVARFGTGRVGHAVSAGLELSHETSKNFARSGPTAPQADLFHPNPSDPYAGPITRTGARTTGIANSLAAYTFDTVSLGDRLELTGGLRWERFEAETESVATTGVLTPFDRVDHLVSWRAGAVFKPRSTGSVYVGYGTSANPSAEGLSLSASTVTLDPEQTRNYEVGTKWDAIGGRLSASAAVFRTEKTNARTPGINPGDPPTVLEGEQLVSGLELGVSGRVARRWSIFSGYAFMDSAIEASNVVGELDNALTLTPRHTMSLWTTYDLPWNVSIGGGAQYMDAVFRNATNTAKVPSYWLANALVSYKVNDHMTLRMNGQNLGDTRYVDRVGGGHYIPGPGRQVMLTTDFRF